MMQTTNITAAKDGRNNTVQIFRALAIIAVVMIHTTPLGHWQVFCRPFINFSVATFLFLSGYLTKIDNNNWIVFFKKRIFRVVIPYIIWTILYTLASGHLNKLPLNLITAKAATPLYYIFVYIQFVLLTPLLGKLAKSKYLYLGFLVAPISIILFYYYGLLTGHGYSDLASLFWSDACLGWFTFYYLGLLLGNRIIEKHFSLKTLTLLYIASILLQMAEGYGLFMLGDINCGTQKKLTSLLTSSLFLLISYTILQNREFDIRNKFLRLIGDYSFGIFLCHIMVLRVFKDYITFYKFVPYPVSSAIILLISLLCCYLGDRICGKKISRWLGFR